MVVQRHLKRNLPGSLLTHRSQPGFAVPARGYGFLVLDTPARRHERDVAQVRVDRFRREPLLERGRDFVAPRRPLPLLARVAIH